MNRYFCLAPNENSARDCVFQLLNANFDEHHISLIADASKVLDEVSMEEESKTWDVLDILQRSIARGGAPGMFAGLRAVTLPSINIMLAGKAILSADHVSLGFQVVLSHSLHIHVSPRMLQRLQNEIVAGKVLLILGIEPLLAPSFDRFVLRKCPEIEFISDIGVPKTSNDDDFVGLMLN